MNICNTFEYFGNRSKFKDVSFLLLAILDKLIKENDELKNSNSQLQTQIHTCPEGESFLLWCGTEVTKPNTSPHDNTRWVAVQVSCPALKNICNYSETTDQTGNRFISWARDVWEEFDEVQDMEFLNSYEIIFSSGDFSHPNGRGIPTAITCSVDLSTYT